MPASQGEEGFVAFFRRYTKTWYHAVATAALTAFGLLTSYESLFAVVAVGSYVLPPLVLYSTGSLPATDEAGAADDSPRSADADPASDPDGAEEHEYDPGSASGAEPEPEPEPGWRRADAPTDETLADVVATDGGAYAVGDGGSVLAGGPDGWHVVVPDGPGAASNPLAGVDATDDGVWFAGENGAVGRLDPGTDRHVDHSAPDGDTTNLAGVAATGGAGGETVVLVDGSGRVRLGRYRDGEVAWEEPVTPGSGSSLSGVTLPDASRGFLCDTNDGVYAVADSGTAFDRVGLDAADGTLADVAATPEGCLVCDDAGAVHRYDGSTGTWTPVRVDDGPLHALAARDGRGLAGGDGGAAFERADGAADWERIVTPVTVPLYGVALGEDGAVAVGADGTVVERDAR